MASEHRSGNDGVTPTRHGRRRALSHSNATVPHGGIKDLSVAQSRRSGLGGLRVLAIHRRKLGMRRAGADLLITYFARALAQRLQASPGAAEAAR